jgi:hypothetical protein
MNGASRNERKHVNHNEDYEVRYARNKPSRTGYKGKRSFADGGDFQAGFYEDGGKTESKKTKFVETRAEAVKLTERIGYYYPLLDAKKNIIGFGIPK